MRASSVADAAALSGTGTLAFTVVGSPRRRRGPGPAIVAAVADRAGVEDLFGAARAGSPEARPELYCVVRPQLFRFARVRLATDEQAEEAVSETMARAIAGQHRYRPGSGATAWMVGICRNVVYETYRAGGRVQVTDPDVLARTDGPSSDAGPAERVLADAEGKGLLAAFARLSPEDQEVLTLRVVAGLDTPEVAAAMGKRAGAVRMAQSRALGRLRVLIEEDA